MLKQDYNDETFINNLVDSYKETGDENLKEAILSAFSPYFKKHASLLCSCSAVDLSNKDTMRLLRLFMSKEDRANNESSFNAGKKLVTKLRDIFKDFTPQDIYDELVCYFLEQLARYKPMIADHKHDKPRISFTHFIQVNIRFKLNTLIRRKFKDALSCAFNIEFDDAMPGTQNTIGINWNPIDMKWVQGITSSEIFKELTEMDRYLLFLKYEDENKKPLSDYEVANLTGLDRMYIRRKFLSIKDKLRSLV